MSALLTKLVCIQVYFTAAFCKDDIPSQRRSRLLIFDDRPNQTVVLSRIVPAQTDRQGSQPERMILSWWEWSWAMQALRNGLRLGGRQLDNEGNPQQAELENERSWFKENTQEVLCYGKPNECCNINDSILFPVPDRQLLLIQDPWPWPLNLKPRLLFLITSSLTEVWQLTDEDEVDLSVEHGEVRQERLD